MPEDLDECEALARRGVGAAEREGVIIGRLFGRASRDDQTEMRENNTMAGKHRASRSKASGQNEARE